MLSYIEFKVLQNAQIFDFILHSQYFWLDNLYSKLASRDIQSLFMIYCIFIFFWWARKSGEMKQVKNLDLKPKIRKFPLIQDSLEI